MKKNVTYVEKRDFKADLIMTTFKTFLRMLRKVALDQQNIESPFSPYSNHTFDRRTEPAAAADFEKRDPSFFPPTFLGKRIEPPHFNPICQG